MLTRGFFSFLDSLDRAVQVGIREETRHAEAITVSGQTSVRQRACVSTRVVEKRRERPMVAPKQEKKEKHIAYLSRRARRFYMYVCIAILLLVMVLELIIGLQ